MFCPHCGAQLDDDSQFCASCGKPINDVAPAPAAAQPAAGAVPHTPAPQAAPAAPYTPAPQAVPRTSRAHAAVPGAFPGAAPTAHAAAPQPGMYPGAVPHVAPQRRFSINAAAFAAPFALGQRTLTLLAGTLVTIILMMQSWIALPVLTKSLDLGTAGAGSQAQYLSLAKPLLNSAFPVSDLPGLAGMFSGFASLLNTQISAVSGVASVSNNAAAAVAQAQAGIGALNTAALVLNIIFVLWLVCLVALVVGLVLKFLKANEFVLFLALVGTAVLALICAIGTMVVNGQVDSNITALLTAVGQGSAATQVAAVKPFLEPTIFAWLSVLVAGGTAAASRMLKD